jgi:hypothetical protein
VTDLPVLRYDPERNFPPLAGATGIYVRAQRPDGRWDNADIAELDRDSLLAWLRSRDAGFAEQVVLAMLGHDQREGG